MLSAQNVDPFFSSQVCRDQLRARLIYKASKKRRFAEANGRSATARRPVHKSAPSEAPHGIQPSSSKLLTASSSEAPASLPAAEEAVASVVGSWLLDDDFFQRNERNGDLERERVDADFEPLDDSRPDVADLRDTDE